MGSVTKPWSFQLNNGRSRLQSTYRKVYRSAQPLGPRSLSDARTSGDQAGGSFCCREKGVHYPPEGRYLYLTIAFSQTADF